MVITFWESTEKILGENSGKIYGHLQESIKSLEIEENFKAILKNI